MKKFLTEFLAETFTALDVINAELDKYKRDNGDKRTILDNIIRQFHTIKGTCGFLNLPRLERMAHAGETVLVQFRNPTIHVTPEMLSLISRSVDSIKDLLIHIEATQSEPKGNDDNLIDALTQAADNLSPTLEDLANAATTNSPNPSKSKPSPSLISIIRNRSSDEPAFSRKSIQVDVKILEGLASTIAELALVRGQLLNFMGDEADLKYSGPLQRLSDVSNELRELILKTRTRPIGDAWERLPRIVRHISQALHKKIDFRMIGAETEVDCDIVELVKDPLMHIVRNSCDHGLEQPEERTANGKPETGRLVLKSAVIDRHIVIEVEDDGRGLNFEQIRKRIVSDGYASQSEVESMTNNQVAAFVLQAGFSTVDEVTNISGRGVGMDVVQTNISIAGGTVDFHSIRGRGATVTIKIPLNFSAAAFDERQGRNKEIAEFNNTAS